MLQTPLGRLQLILERTAEEVFEPDAVSDAPYVRFAAYVAKQRVFGWIRMHEDRLTDLLNAHEELQLVDVGLEILPHGRLGSIDEVVIHRRDLIAVQASGPRGDASLRRVTQPHPIAIRAGTYLIAGYLHTPPGVDPMADVWTRPVMFPVTDAAIEYWTGGKPVHQATGTIIVNRNAVDWIKVVSHDDLIEGHLRLE